MNAIARKRFKPLPPLPSLSDPSFPAEYALTLQGDCLEPHILDGSTLLVSSDRLPRSGELAVIYPAEGVDLGCGPGAAMCKLVVYNAPPWVKSYPYKDHPKSTALAAITFGLYKPGGTFTMQCSDIAALHVVTGVVRPRRKEL